MLAALLLLGSQPAPLDAVPAPQSGSFGWIEQLAGSCFEQERSRRRIIASRWIECFEMRGGRFVTISIYWHPRFEYRTECVLQSVQAGQLRFACSRGGSAMPPMAAHYAGDAFVTRQIDERSAVSRPQERERIFWRRPGPDQLSSTATGPSSFDAWEPDQGSEPRIFNRIERRPGRRGQARPRPPGS